MAVSMSRRLVAGLVAGWAVLGVARAEGVLQLADVIELSGGGATVGQLWRNGVDLAVDDINAAGGVLGQKLAVTHYDTASNPSAARAALQKALDGQPYAVLGPIYSSSVKAAMPLTQAAGIVELVGGEASDLTKLGNPALFRTSFGQVDSMPKIARYMARELKAKKVAVLWVNDDFGRGGHDAVVAALKAEGVEVTADLSSEAGQADFAADVLRARRNRPDAVFVYLHEEESARFLREAKKQGLNLPLIGETTLMNQQTIGLAGDAAEGVRGHVGLTADAPVPAVEGLSKRYKARFNVVPDHNALKGYMSVWMVKAGTEKLGVAERTKLAGALHGMTITPGEQPGILMPVTIDAHGDIDRESFLVEVQGGRQKVVQVLPKLN